VTETARKKKRKQKWYDDIKEKRKDVGGDFAGAITVSDVAAEVLLDRVTTITHGGTNSDHFIFVDLSPIPTQHFLLAQIKTSSLSFSHFFKLEPLLFTWSCYEISLTTLLHLSKTLFFRFYTRSISFHSFFSYTLKFCVLYFSYTLKRIHNLLRHFDVFLRNFECQKNNFLGPCMCGFEALDQFRTIIFL